MYVNNLHMECTLIELIHQTTLDSFFFWYKKSMDYRVYINRINTPNHLRFFFYWYKKRDSFSTFVKTPK